MICIVLQRESYVLLIVKIFHASGLYLYKYSLLEFQEINAKLVASSDSQVYAGLFLLTIAFATLFNLYE